MEDIEAERGSHLRKVGQSVDCSEKAVMETSLKLEKMRIILEQKEGHRKQIQNHFIKRERERIFQKVLNEAGEKIEKIKLQ